MFHIVKQAAHGGWQLVLFVSHYVWDTQFVIKIELGGVTGLVAPLIGKKPPDIHVWIIGGTAPAFVKEEGPFYMGGPIWNIQLTSPVWPRGPR